MLSKVGKTWYNTTNKLSLGKIRFLKKNGVSFAPGNEETTAVLGWKIANIRFVRKQPKTG